MSERFDSGLEAEFEPGSGPEQTMGDATRAVDAQRDHSLIMMVDDDLLAIDAIEAFLADAGYENYVGISDSTEALARIEAERPDALLLDLQMPKVSGFDILEEMNTRPSLARVPILVLTSATDADTKLKCLELGCTDFLAKPVDPSELALRLRNVLAAKAFQDRLTYYDPLTGLPNRKRFLERLATVVSSRAQRSGISAVLHLGLDQFQRINDSMGLVAADKLLQHVSQRLVDRVRSRDRSADADERGLRTEISRLGGDEFCVLVVDAPDAGAVEAIARRVLSIFDHPFEVDGRESFLAASIGIAISPRDASGPVGLLRCASTAMAHAKTQGGNALAFYSSELKAESARRLALTNDLRKAIGRDELVLWYQPKVNLESGRIEGAEALMRWEHPELGLVFPDTFIPLAEESNLISAMGAWAIHEAARQHRDWLDRHGQALRVSVNVSGEQFADAHLPELVSHALSEAGIGPEALCVEITETVVMRDAETSIRCLERLREMGIELSVDDFGTGYSSLAYLKRLPVDELKIDRSFVKDLHVDRDDRAIVAAVILMARALGLRVVAEGVEETEQLSFLRARRCNAYQGYLFSRPVPAAEFSRLLEGGKPSAEIPRR